MASTTSTFGPILTPEHAGDLVIQQSVAGQIPWCAIVGLNQLARHR
jgi:hypothetical protein